MKRRVVVGWAKKGLAVLPGRSSVGDVTDVFFACRRYVFRTNCLCSVGQLQCCAKERKQWRRVVLQTVTEAHQAAMLWEWPKKSRFICDRRHAFQTAKLWKSRFVRFTAFFTDVPSDWQCQRTCVCIAKFKKNLFLKSFPALFPTWHRFSPSSVAENVCNGCCQCQARSRELLLFPLEGTDDAVYYWRIKYWAKWELISVVFSRVIGWRQHVWLGLTFRCSALEMSFITDRWRWDKQHQAL